MERGNLPQAALGRTKECEKSGRGAAPLLNTIRADSQR